MTASSVASLQWTALAVEAGTTAAHRPDSEKSDGADIDARRPARRGGIGMRIRGFGVVARGTIPEFVQVTDSVDHGSCRPEQLPPNVLLHASYCCGYSSEVRGRRGTRSQVRVGEQVR